MQQQQQQRQPQQGQQPVARQAPMRILRIGIVLGGNIIEERLVRKRETVTIGQSAKNTFSVPIEGLPLSTPMFLLNNNEYYLTFQDNMDGRISAGGTVHTLGQLKQQNYAKRNGKDWIIKLDERSRGKVTVGAMTLLFQFVTAPPLQPRPRLPASVRGTLADRIEPRLAIILTTSVLAHFAFGLWAYTRPTKAKKPVEKIARQFQVNEYVPPPPPPDPIETPTDGDDDKTQGASEVPTKEPTTKPKGPKEPKPKNDGGSQVAGGDPDEGAPDEAAINEAIANTAVVAVLTGDGTSGGAFSEMSGTDQGASLDDSIAHAKGKAGVTAQGDPAGRQRNQGSDKLGTGKGGGVSGPSGGDGGPVGGNKAEEKIQSRVKLGGADDLSLSDLDPDAVVARIRGKYLAGIKQCHQRVLKADPEAQGKVTIAFTVGPTGRVTRAKVNGFNPTVDSCIQAQAAKWRFSAPKDDGKPTSADFSVPLLLKPGA